MRTTVSKIGGFIAFVLLIGGLAAAFLVDWHAQGKSVLEKLLRQSITDQGYSQLQYTLQEVTPKRITFTDISLAGESPITARKIIIDYVPAELLAHFSRGHDIHLVLHLQDASLGGILQGATAGRATATGLVSGNLPVTIEANGQVVVEEGNLTAYQGGVITLSPEVIPGDNEQVALVREVMKGFHYNTFLMSLASGKDKKLSILLSLGGNNPDVYNGQEIKLNVQLSGDLLDLLQQSILPLADPKQLLKDEHAKH